MKAKDIIVGQEYAVGSADYPDRAVVLEVGNLERQVGIRGYSRRTSTAPAARVRVLAHDGSELAEGAYQRERVFPLGQVRWTWTDEVKRKAHRLAEDSRSQERLLRRGGIANDLEKALARHGVSSITRVGYPSSAIEVAIYDEGAATRLVDLLNSVEQVGV